MPEAIAAAIVTAIGLTGTAAAVVSAVIQLAIVVGLNFAAQAVFGKGGVGKPSDGQKIIRENVSSRVRHYGIVHVGGVLSFYESKNGTLYAVVTTGHGRLNSILEHRLNNKVVTVDGSGTVTDPKFRGAIKILTRLGEDDQTAVAELTAAYPAWTSDHRQRGCSLAALIFGGVQQKYFSEVYEGNQEPAYTRVAEGALVYDPRKDDTAVIGYDEAGEPVMGSGSHRIDDPDTWEWSDNAALVIGDYLAHPDGYGLGWDGVNWTNIAGEADVSDEVVETVDGRSVARWRLWGSYKLAEDERRSVLKEMTKACDGFVFQDAEGKANLRVGRWLEPTVHLTADHIISVTASLGGDPQERTNEVRVIYVDPRFDYSETESAPQINAAEQARIGRSEVQRFDAYYCPDHNQASRLGKRFLAKLGPVWNLTVTCNLYALNLIGERFALLTLEELGITAGSFEVTAFKIDPQTNLVELGLAGAAAADFDFDAAVEEGDPPAEPGDTSTAYELDPPEGLTLTDVQVNLGESNGVGILAEWDAGRLGLTYEAQIQPTDASLPAAGMTVDQDALTATSAIVASGTEYTVRVRAISLGGRVSDWAEATITPEADNPEVAPSPPTNLDVDVTGNDAALQWRNPPESNFGFVRIYRNTVNNFGTATALSGDESGGTLADKTRTDTGLAAGHYYWWFVSYNADGSLASTPAGPVDAMVLYSAGSNPVTAPADFTDAAWTRDNAGTGSSNPVVTADYGNAPDGSATADRIQFTRGNTPPSFSRIQQGVTVSNATSYRFGVWLKAPSAGYSVCLRMDGNNGPTLSLTTSWEFYSLTATSTSTSMAVQMLIFSSVTNSPLSADVQAWGAQIAPA
jgi:hypothetical protein